MRGTRGRGTTLALAALLALVVSGCGGEQNDVTEPAVPATSATPSPTATSPAFTMPENGDQLGAQVTARPEDAETSKGAAAFAAWTLSLLLHTPRDDTTTQLWDEAAGAGCEPCRKAAAVWQDQASKGQVFHYVRPAQLVDTVVRAQRQGDGWFVEYEVAVPRSTLTKGNRVVQSVPAEHLDYTFRLSWVDDAWRLEDFHVLG
jgi:hypothetical protein